MSAPTRIVTDLNGRIVEASAEAGELLAIDGRWLPGKPLAAFVARERVREFRMLLLDLAHGDGPVGTTLRLQKRGGEQVDVEVETLAEARGDRLEWLFATPATAEEPPDAVPPPKGLPLQELLGRLPIGVISVDRELTVDYVNPAARVFVSGATSGSILPDPLPGLSLRKFARRLFGPSPPVRQVAETTSGRLLEVDGIAGGDEQRAVLLVQDVTSRERRRRAEQEFAANAAHELRTPIAAIVSALEVLQGGAKNVPGDLDRFLGHIERETARLGRLVGALLLLARIQTGQAKPSLQLLELSPLLEEVAADLDPRDGVELQVECPAGTRLLADPELLRQAVWNVALNAIGNTKSGVVQLIGRDLGAMAEIEVRDTGVGIAPEDREHIFDRFYRSRKQSRGFGLGLPISQAIAQELGGSLMLDSELGVGTRVRIHVPSARLVA